MLSSAQNLKPYSDEYYLLNALFVLIGHATATPKEKKSALDILFKNKELAKHQMALNNLAISLDDATLVTAISEILPIISHDLASQIITQIRHYVSPSEGTDPDEYNLDYFRVTVRLRIQQLSRIAFLVKKETLTQIEGFNSLPRGKQVDLAKDIRQNINVALSGMDTSPFTGKNALEANQVLNGSLKALLLSLARAFNSWASKPATISNIANIPPVDEQKSSLATQQDSGSARTRESKRDPNRFTAPSEDLITTSLNATLASGDKFNRRNTKKSSFKWRGAALGATGPTIPALIVIWAWGLNPLLGAGLTLLSLLIGGITGALVENKCCCRDDNAQNGDLQDITKEVDAAVKAESASKLQRGNVNPSLTVMAAKSAKSRPDHDQDLSATPPTTPKSAASSRGLSTVVVDGKAKQMNSHAADFHANAAALSKKFGAQ